MIGSQQVAFGDNDNQVSHTFRHTDELDLPRAEIVEAIRADLEPRLPLARRPGGTARVVGIVVVRGIQLKCHAYPVNEERVNVGRITGP